MPIPEDDLKRELLAFAMWLEDNADRVAEREMMAAFDFENLSEIPVARMTGAMVEEYLSAKFELP